MQLKLETDVAVVGGGISGFNAALAAAQLGVSVTIIEKFPFLGGTATAGMVAAFNGFYWHNQKVTTGTADLILEELERNGGGNGFQDYTAGKLTDNPFTFKVYPFDPEVMKISLDNLAARFRIRVLHHSSVFNSEVDGQNRILQILGPSKQYMVKAKQVVDASGDAIVADAAGAQLLKPPVAERQPMTQMMRISNVDHQMFAAVPGGQKRELVQTGIESGEFYYRTIAQSSSPVNGDTFLLVTSVEGFDGLDALEASAAEVEGRRQAVLSLKYLRRVMPGFEEASLVQLAPRIGQRETVRVQGFETLTKESVASGDDHPEAISYGGGPIDRHIGDSVRLAPPASPFAVPKSALIPREVSRMTLAGRIISAEPEAMDALRHMGGMMPVGQASGVIAGLAAAYDLEPKNVEYESVRKVLVDQGATLDLTHSKARL